MKLPIELALPHAKPGARPAAERTSARIRAEAAPAARAEARRPAGASAVARLREAAIGAAARAGLAALEHDIVSGKGAKLRKAARKLPPALARVRPRSQQAPATQSDADGSDEPRADAAPAAERAPQAHGRDAQTPTQSVRLDLPLPDEGEARVAVEQHETDNGDAYRVDVELDLAALGSLGVHLIADESQILCRVDVADDSARAQLESALGDLRDALVAATGKPVTVGLGQPRDEAPRLAPPPGVNAYA
jgi:hypothetical protein